MKRLTILGSTGSIGTSTLSVVRQNPEKFQVLALVAGKNVTDMAIQCLEFNPNYVSMADERSQKASRTILTEHNCKTNVSSRTETPTQST